MKFPRKPKKGTADEAAFEPRGPQDHALREGIVAAAQRLFEHFGFDKTSVADIAKELEVSPAYVYKFFDSKAAIGEAVASSRVATIHAALWEVARSDATARVRFRQLFDRLVTAGKRTFAASRRMHELTILAIESKWPAVARHKAGLVEIFRSVLEAAAEEGELRSDDPARDAAAVVDGLYLVAHPIILQEMIDQDLEMRAARLAGLFERALFV